MSRWRSRRYNLPVIAHIHRPIILTADGAGALDASERTAFQQGVEFPGNKRNQSFRSSFAFRLHSRWSHTGSSFWKPTVTIAKHALQVTQATHYTHGKQRASALVVIHAEHVVHRRGYCFDFGCMFVCLYVC